MATKKTDNVNHNILNIITPTALDFKKNSLVISENFAKLYTVSKYPVEPKFGWLGSIVQVEGTTASIEFHPTESGPLVERCNDQINDLKRDLTNVKDESIRQKKDKGVTDIKNLIHRIAIKGETVGYVNILLLIQAPSEEKLDERVKRVSSILTASGGSIRSLSNNQKEAYSSIAPYGVPNEKLFDIGCRNMPLSTFIGGFVNASSGINDGIGIKIGVSENGKPCIIDTWQRGGDRTNSNWYVAGVPGVGKSAFVKLLLGLEYALGTKIIILDPEREFIEYTVNMGGKVISCCGGPGGRINPLQVRPAPKLEVDDDLIDEYYKDEGKGMSDLALHFQTHRTFIRLYKKDLSEIDIAYYEEVLEKTYRRFGIVWNTNINKLKNTDFPIYSDFYEDLAKEEKENPNDPVYKKLLKLFYSIAKGADSYIWNGHTDVEENSDWTTLDISALLDSDESIIRSQFHNINGWAWHQVAKDRTEKIAYAVDEGHLTVDPDCPQAMVFAKNMAKRIRKYEGAYIFITHAPSDILDPAVKRYGQAIIDTACYKFIMGMDGKNLEETCKLFNLTEAERNVLMRKIRGKGILFAGSKRIVAHIKIPLPILDLMGKGGGR